MIGKFNEIPLGELTTPREGYVCMLNRFWLIGPGGGALSYDEQPRYGSTRRYAQCNTQEAMCKMWVGSRKTGAVSYKLVPVAYWKPNT